MAKPSQVPSCRLHDNTKPATYKDLTNAYSLDVAIVDGSGNQITSFGGGSPSLSFDHGATSNITTTAVQLTANTIASSYGVVVKSDITNEGIVAIGNSDVTVGATVTTDGFELSAGDGITLEVSGPHLLYSIGNTTTAQRVTWLVI